MLGHKYLINEKGKKSESKEERKEEEKKEKNERANGQTALEEF